MSRWGRPLPVGCAREGGFIVDPIADLGADFYVYRGGRSDARDRRRSETHVHADSSPARASWRRLSARRITCHRELRDLPFTRSRTIRSSRSASSASRCCLRLGIRRSIAAIWLLMVAGSRSPGSSCQAIRCLSAMSAVLISWSETRRSTSWTRGTRPAAVSINTRETLHPSGARRGVSGSLRRICLRRRST